MNGVVATLNFILGNAVMFQITEGQLAKDMVDLGLPKGTSCLRVRKRGEHCKDLQEQP
jgi:hypothetical protein